MFRYLSAAFFFQTSVSIVLFLLALVYYGGSGSFVSMLRHVPMSAFSNICNVNFVFVHVVSCCSVVDLVLPCHKHVFILFSFVMVVLVRLFVFALDSEI